MVLLFIFNFVCFHNYVCLYPNFRITLVVNFLKILDMQDLLTTTNLVVIGNKYKN